MRVEGVKQLVPYYTLDVIISVGYRVKSKHGVEFRRWANSVLKQYILQGYAVNDKRIVQLGEVIKIMKRTENTLDSKQVLTVIEKYSEALELLDSYDHQSMNRPKRKQHICFTLSQKTTAFLTVTSELQRPCSYTSSTETAYCLRMERS